MEISIKIEYKYETALLYLPESSLLILSVRRDSYEEDVTKLLSLAMKIIYE